MYLEILSDLFSTELTLFLSFTKRLLYHNQINSKGNRIRFYKDDYNTMREYYITFRYNSEDKDFEKHIFSFQPGGVFSRGPR